LFPQIATLGTSLTHNTITITACMI
jgi:hypothetical protein